MKTICILGPTAVGKTDLALAIAQRRPCQLISVDSAQVYRGLDIGTAKPSRELQAAFPHALIDLVEPEDSYSAARFCADCRLVLEEARAAGKLPLLVGGSMLYFYSLFNGLDDLPPSQPELRNAILERIRGGEDLYGRLQALDPPTAASFSPRDHKRLSRCWEIIEITGQTPSQLYGRQRPPGPPADLLVIGLNIDRSELHRRIQERFLNMIKAGLIDEVAGLLARPAINLTLPAMQSAGYQQIGRYLLGQWDKVSAVEQAIIATRQLAKRQITWMNNRLGQALAVEVFAPNSPALMARIDAFLNS